MSKKVFNLLCLMLCSVVLLAQSGSNANESDDFIISGSESHSGAIETVNIHIVDHYFKSLLQSDRLNIGTINYKIESRKDVTSDSLFYIIIGYGNDGIQKWRCSYIDMKICLF